MQLSPDDTVIFTILGIGINATIANTWVIMAVLAGVSALITRNLRPDVPPSRWRTALEVIVDGETTETIPITEADRDPLSPVVRLRATCRGCSMPPTCSRTTARWCSPRAPGP